MENGYLVDLGCFAAYVIASVTLAAFGFNGSAAILSLLALAHMASMVVYMAQSYGSQIVSAGAFTVTSFLSVIAALVFAVFAVVTIAGVLSNG